MFNLPKIEKEVLKRWEKDNTFQKSLAKDSPQGDYVFYDGPPFATGLPHYGHLVGGLMKDIVPRYWTMKGYYVERRWGWDTHGLPIENIIEKELGFKAKKDIEDYGIDKFNQACHSKVMLYRDEWRGTIERFGRWADMDNDYKTMDTEYMESVWWVFKQLWDKDLIYKAYKSMHICPRCETTLSQSEVTEGYKDVKDLSITAKFELADEPGTYLLSWTTTPWTLPGNVALAVGDDIEYAIFEKITGNDNRLSIGEKIILAEGDINSPNPTFQLVLFTGKHYSEVEPGIFEDSSGEKYERKGLVKGSELVGRRYKPLFDYYSSQKDLVNKENGWQIYGADFVNTEEGTGVVHIAPAFGEDDMNLGKEHDLPFVQHVSLDGHFKPEVTDFAGLSVKPIDDPMETDVKILKYLAKKDLVFSKEKYEHSYPHCWRCETPLLNYATSSWFVAVTKIKDEMLENAKNISWMPAHMKEGRFGNWLEGARDWSISRQRFWGSVMPIWTCDKESCDETRVFGSIVELEEASGEKIKDLHKHTMDKVTFACNKCGSSMQRIPDVLDCWFESGSMPYAQQHYPFENKEKFERNFPAQFIAEGADQTRAWFYYLHVLSTAVKTSESFKNVIVNGIVLAEDGKKMAKRLQNYPEPDAMFDKYGADAVRYYLATSPVMHGDDLNFSEKGVQEKSRMFMTLYNVVSFYKMFANHGSVQIDRQINTDIIGSLTANDLTHVLDVWITAKLNELTKSITQYLDGYDITRAARHIEEFIAELSTWYVRRSRDRFKSDDESVKIPALRTLSHVIFNMSRLMAPFTPFISDYIYEQEMKGDKSVHLQDWPEPNFEDTIDKFGVIEKMALTRQVVEMGLAKRDEAKLPVKQPLANIKVFGSDLGDEYLELIKDELNIKQVLQEAGGELSVQLDINITEELRLEGIKRDFVRQINKLRKAQKLTIQDKVKLGVSTDSEDIKKVIELYEGDILQATIASEFMEGVEGGEAVKVSGEEIKVKIIKQ